MSLPIDHPQRLARARVCLDGLSIGDAFGERFFLADERGVLEQVRARRLPPPKWAFTDDTVMALSIVDVLAGRGCIDRDHLSQLFAARYQRDPRRGYGATAHQVLARIAAGERWHDVAPRVFDGAGSMGNGGAMRSAPVGAYFCDDFDRAASEAQASAEVTHAHREGQAGAIAVAVAAAWVASGGKVPGEMFEAVLVHTPKSDTRAGIAKAAALPSTGDVHGAAVVLGSGARVTAPDTVPFALWCAARHLGTYEEALWTTVAGLGDRDTTCAIVGGIVALHVAAEIPAAWRQAREALDVLAHVVPELP